MKEGPEKGALKEKALGKGVLKVLAQSRMIAEGQMQFVTELFGVGLRERALPHAKNECGYYLVSSEKHSQLITEGYYINLAALFNLQV